MAITDDRTPLRGYTKPSSENDLQDDVLRVRGALDAIDQDMAAVQDAVDDAVDTAGGAQASATAAQQAASAAAGQADAARKMVAVSGTDTAPGGLAEKIELADPIYEEISNPTADARLVVRIRDASTTQRGAIRLADDTETSTGSSTDTAVSPAALKKVLGTATGATKIPRIARTANAALVGTNRGAFIDVTANSFTQTMASAAQLGADWWVYYRNSGTGDITIQAAASEQIDGAASYVIYPGETRLLMSDGTTVRSIIITSFVRAFSTSGTFTKAPGYAFFDVEAVGAGGGGAGGGTKKAGVNDVYGGGGGGGGLLARRRLAAARVGTTEAVSIGAPGTGGAGAAVNSALVIGANGNAGGSSSFGSLVVAPGGGAGLSGQSTTNGGGVGGSIPQLGSDYVGGPSVNGAALPTTVPVFGGGGGGCSRDYFRNVPCPGQASFEGGPGGGGGGGLAGSAGGWPADNTFKYPGSDGGGLWSFGMTTTAGGALGGAKTNLVTGPGSSGADGVMVNGSIRGTAGGGGGCGGTTGGNGGAGGPGAGGGGGGSGFNGKGGNGGNGGAGAVRVAGVV